MRGSSQRTVSGRDERFGCFLPPHLLSFQRSIPDRAMLALVLCARTRSLAGPAAAAVIGAVLAALYAG
jgi:hypothetical protein